MRGGLPPFVTPRRRTAGDRHFANLVTLKKDVAGMGERVDDGGPTLLHDINWLARDRDRNTTRSSPQAEGQSPIRFEQAYAPGGRKQRQMNERKPTVTTAHNASVCRAPSGAVCCSPPPAHAGASCVAAPPPIKWPSVVRLVRRPAGAAASWRARALAAPAWIQS
jgi:hypothetical protein